ncbi:MAG: hypothetical protein ABFR35_10450 [Thermodesulfobacteriota bacterium]
MDTKKGILLQYSLAGALVGYFVFHPLVMLLSHLMTAQNTALNLTDATGFMNVVIMQSFTTAMLPWSLSFTVFNGIIGWYYGILKVEKMAREELIENLQKALEDVKTLSGMLPICAWCKNIRNDEGYWQKIEAYFKSHSDLDFTHSICNDCAKKEYPELYPESEEKMTDENLSS